MTPEMLATLTEQVTELVQTYSDNYPQFQRATYNETQVRVDFVNRFFKLLGWDVEEQLATVPNATRRTVLEHSIVALNADLNRAIDALYQVETQEVEE